MTWFNKNIEGKAGSTRARECNRFSYIFGCGEPALCIGQQSNFRCFDHPAYGVTAIFRYVEAFQKRERTGGGNFENGAHAIGAAAERSAIKGAITGLYQAALGISAVGGAIQVFKLGDRTTRSDFKNNPFAIRAAQAKCAV